MEPYLYLSGGGAGELAAQHVESHPLQQVLLVAGRSGGSAHEPLSDQGRVTRGLEIQSGPFPMEDQFGKINCKKNVSTNMFIPMLVIEEVPGPRIFLDPFGSLPANRGIFRRRKAVFRTNILAGGMRKVRNLWLPSLSQINTPTSCGAVCLLPCTVATFF